MTGKMHTIGSRRQVWNGTAKKTPGGLLKSDLMMNKHGRIVSRAKHASAKRDNRLVKAGYGTKKGTFGFVKMGSRKMRKGSKKHMKGGHSNIYSSMSPANYNGIAGQGITVGDAGSANVQLLAGMAGGRRRRRRGMMMMGGTTSPSNMALKMAGMGKTYNGPQTMAGQAL